MIDWLIQRAKRTPYYPLVGYMNRWWLVPYSEVVERHAPRAGEKGEDPESYEFYYNITTDGTGPVSWRRPIAKLLQKLGIAVRIHEILRSDEGRHPHSHPWSYLTIILRGCYFEERYDEHGEIVSFKAHGPGSILWRPAGSLHRLTLQTLATKWVRCGLQPPDETFKRRLPVTTLFITFRKQGSWGFCVDGKMVPWREYLNEKGNG